MAAVDNIGVEIALSAASAAEAAAWVEKVELSAADSATAAFRRGGSGWAAAGLTAELVPRLRGLVQLLDVPEFR